jgi:hypothetical protein
MLSARPGQGDLGDWRMNEPGQLPHESPPLRPWRPGPLRTPSPKQPASLPAVPPPIPALPEPLYSNQNAPQMPAYTPRAVQQRPLQFPPVPLYNHQNTPQMLAFMPPTAQQGPFFQVGTTPPGCFQYRPPTHSLTTPSSSAAPLPGGVPPSPAMSSSGHFGPPLTSRMKIQVPFPKDSTGN